MKTLAEFAKSEYKTTSSELARLSPQEAVVKFYHRQDLAISKAIADASTKPACNTGCSYCCHYKVEAIAAEIIAIHQYTINRFKPEKLQAVITQARYNVEEVKNLSYKEHMTTNQQCPFLFDDKCSIYPVRPSKCRSFHASDVDGCRISYDNPTDLNIPNSYIREVFETANGTTNGFNAAMRAFNIDSRMYDLNSAFLEAMQSAAAAKRLKNGKRVFLHAKTEMP